MDAVVLGRVWCMKCLKANHGAADCPSLLSHEHGPPSATAVKPDTAGPTKLTEVFSIFACEEKVLTELQSQPQSATPKNQWQYYVQQWNGFDPRNLCQKLAG